MEGWKNMTELWNKYYSEYIQKHKADGKDIFQLTNEAINYCMKKLGLKVQQITDKIITPSRRGSLANVKRVFYGGFEHEGIEKNWKSCGC